MTTPASPSILHGLPVAPLALARGTATLAGLTGVAMGIRALLDPRSYCATFGFGAGSPTARAAASNAFVAIAGARAAASGLAILGCVALGADRALGALLATSLLAGLVDGAAVLRYGGYEEGQVRVNGYNGGDDDGGGAAGRERVGAAWKKAWGHWGVVGVVSAMGAWMLVSCEN